MNRVQGRLYLITWPSRRTYLLVETPTLVVCGAIGLPISAPTELSEGSSSAGMCRSPPTEYWNPPNRALVEVLLPDRATPMNPMTGSRMRNVGPSWAKPGASEVDVPEEVPTGRIAPV